MKKMNLFLVGMLLLLACPFSHVQAQQITVGIGLSSTTTNVANYPINALVDYSYSQQIYLNSEMGEGKDGMKITQIQFLSAHSSLDKVGNIKVWMANSTQSFYGSGVPIPISNFTLVAEIPGQVGWIPGTWITINLDPPFKYESPNNLVIAMTEGLAGKTEGTTGFNCEQTLTTGTTGSNFRSFWFNSTNPINVETQATGSRQAYHNSIKIIGTLIAPEPEVITGSATDIDVTTATLNGLYDNVSDPFFTGFKYWLESEPDVVSEKSADADAAAGVLTASLENLQPFSTYKYTAYVSWDNGDSFLTGDTLTFKTACPVPVNLSANVTAHAAQVSWNATEADASYDVEYRIADAADWEEETVTDTVWNSPLLTPSTDYEVRVRTACDVDNSSDWTGLSFTTLAVYTVTVSAGSHGSVLPKDETGTEIETGVYQYEEGFEPAFEIKADLGYEKDTVLADDVDVTANVSEENIYTFAPLADDHILSATFKPVTYTIAYHNLNGAANTNPATYTIETPTFVLAALNKITDSAFVAWYANPEYTGNAVDTVKQGSTGNRILYAKWQFSSSIKENTLQNVQVYAYLNTVYIVNPSQTSLKLVEIMDMTGRTVYRSTSVQSPISLNVAEGQYTVRIMSNDSVLNTKVLIR
jgi:hypothetical protein